MQELYAERTARKDSQQRIAQLEREVLQFRGAVEDMVRKEGDKEKAMATSGLLRCCSMRVPETDMANDGLRPQTAAPSDCHQLSPDAGSPRPHADRAFEYRCSADIGRGCVAGRAQDQRGCQRPARSRARETDRESPVRSRPLFQERRATSQREVDGRVRGWMACASECVCART